MTDKLLNQLINEAKNEVRPRAIKQIGHYLGLGGTIADRIALSNELNELVTTYTTQWLCCTNLSVKGFSAI
ncbi:hypothetical protein [Acinetobacter baumannii]|uniref:hypothetical protein n=1 Tax=Acinetobacter baumannii TaxID=470 RepID=UPI001FF6CC16|nr:hypothetical protein [Acinetobacter baumannii]